MLIYDFYYDFTHLTATLLTIVNASKRKPNTPCFKETFKLQNCNDQNQHIKGMVQTDVFMLTPIRYTLTLTLAANTLN